MQTTSQPIEVAFPDLGAWRDGNTGIPYVHMLDSGQPGPHVMVNALTHGNEVCGAIAVDALLALKLRPRRGRVTLSFANVDAYARFDPARPSASRFVDQDLNRVWSAAVLDDAGRTSHELRRARALRGMVEQADLLLDLHSMHDGSQPLMLSGPLAKGIALARAIGTPTHVIIDEGHPEGVRMRDFGAFGDPASPRNALLIECGQHWQQASVGVALDSVARFLVHSGVLDTVDLPGHWYLPLPPAQRVIRVTDAVVARSTDFRFAAPWTGLEVLPEAGTVIGWSDGEPVVTPYPDCVLVMPSLRQLRPGVTVVRLGRGVT
jgi:predicted deacylase